MFIALGRFVVRRARLILSLSVVALIVGAVIGVGAFGRLLSEGFADPSSGSSQAQTLLDRHFDGESDFIFLVQAKDGNVDSPAVTAAGEALAKRLSGDTRLTDVTSYWSSHSPGLRARDGSSALILTTVKGDTDAADKASTGLLSDYSNVNTPATKVLIGGALGSGIGSQVGKDIGRAESFAVPITLILLVVVFGSLVAALLPLSVALLAIVGAFAELSILTHVTSVSVFAINLVTALGLGLGIDYALLTVSRFREELAGGAEVSDAVIRTTATAGRTIAFSALTVMVALSAMLVFPVYFLKSFAYGGVGVTAFAALSALLVLPAILTVLGHRVNAGRIRGIRPARGEAPFWGGLAKGVMRRPALAGVPVVVVLLALAFPLLHVKFSTPDERALPKSAPSHQVGDVLRADYATQPTAIDIVLRPAVSSTALAGYAQQISSFDGVQRDDSSAGSFISGRAATAAVNPASLTAPGLQRVTLTTGLEGSSAAAQRLVRQIRALPAPAGSTALVGGDTASLIDAKHAIGSRLLLAALIIVVTSFILLFLFTGSLLQPLRALVGNGLTLAATLGTMVWIFQDGHLSGVLGFTPTPTNTDMPVLLFCVAFGLSMDYEVFLISRIKELHDSGSSNADAVTHGLARTGRIVSTAAALLAVSFFAFGTSKVSFIQFFGLGTGMAILIDATLVRGVLVPAFMRVLGERSWWAPRPLRRLHDRLGLSESHVPPGNAGVVAT